MFGRKDEKPKKRRTPRENLAQFGFVDMNFDGTSGTGGDDEDGDEDLEAELLALTSEDSGKRKAPKAKPKAIPQEDLDRMVADSMKEDGSEGEESVDEDDPDLLSELNDLTGENEEEAVESPPKSPVQEAAAPSGGNSLVSLLEERLKMYQAAEANAKTAGETSRARRFSRGAKTLTDQLKAARNGRVVNEEDIPPPVATRAGGSVPAQAPAPAPAAPTADSTPLPSEDEPADIPTPVRQAPPPPVPPRLSPPEEPAESMAATVPDQVKESSGSGQLYDPEVVAKLEERRAQYRSAAVSAKKSGNRDAALQFAQIVKQFDIVITGVKNGEHADLSEMPPPPWETELGGAPSPPEPSRVEEQQQKSSEPVPAPAEEATAVPVPTTVMEALTQRLELYQKQEAAAKADGNSSKARRMGRIVKQYQDAIKHHKAGKAIAVDELPTPPGYAPIPVPGSAPPTAAPAAAPAAAPKPSTPPASRRPSGGLAPPTEPPAGPSPTNVRKSPASRQEKQMALLVERQKAFKEAAFQAKSRGDLTEAKEFLRLFKGFDNLIEATERGLPVDLNTLPVPPSAKLTLEADFDVISVEDCVAGSDDEIYEKLISDLNKQVQTCITTRNHFKAMGDIASANRFENMAVHSKKDMVAVKNALKRKDPAPKFHYENRVFSIVQCCTELMDNDLELTIVQGINYNVPNPKDIDTYVKFELPWPSAEEPQKDRTTLVKDTNNPEYNAKFNLQIQRTARACQRIFKRHGIKCEVWSRGGFLRSDTLIGTATVKLQPLESKCVLHDSFDLMDGRKAVGGKLEVKVRLRNPIISKQVEQVTEKWLVIDHF